MTAHHYIFVRILGTTDYTDNIMVFYRTRLKMVAYIKFKEEIPSFLNHLFDNGVLVLIEFYVTYSGKCLECQLIKVFPVIEDSDWNSSRLDDPKYPGFAHFVVEKCRFLFEWHKILRRFIAVFIILPCYFPVQL